MRRAIFCDRDGIVNKKLDADYVKHPEEFILVPEIFLFLPFIHAHNFLAIVITNQQGIAKGLMNEEHLTAIHSMMQEELLARCGERFDDIFFCGDLEGSPRRKPAPAMLHEAATKWKIDLSGSWMVGDSESDIEAGKAAGTTTIFVSAGGRSARADYSVKDLAEAREIILRAEHEASSKQTRSLQ